MFLRTGPRFDGLDLFSLEAWSLLAPDGADHAAIFTQRADDDSRDADRALTPFPDQFEFFPAAIDRFDLPRSDGPQVTSVLELAITWVPTIDLAEGDGRPDPDPDPGSGMPADDTDPDPAPPPIVVVIPPEYEHDGGRPEAATPGPPTATPPAPEPGPENEVYGRPEDAVPDPVDTPVTSYTSGGAAALSYNITVDFAGSWTVALQDAFVTATEYLSSVILADIPDELVEGVLVDDLNISATLAPIDGVGGTLGSAGPRAIRDVSYLPATGEMTFDSADAGNMLNAGTWQSVVFHEIMHTLGFGSHLGLLGLTSGSVAGGDIRFTGDNAIYYYNTEFSAIAASDPDSWLGVPLEADGGPGTAGGHWDEVLFGNEVMTGYNDSTNYISAMTIAALEDISYDTVIDDINSATDLVGTLPPDPLLDLFA